MDMMENLFIMAIVAKIKGFGKRDSAREMNNKSNASGSREVLCAAVMVVVAITGTKMVTIVVVGTEFAEVKGYGKDSIDGGGDLQ